MKIKTRLLIGFGSLIILMFTLVGISIYQMNQMTIGLDQKVKDRYEKVSLSQETKSSVDELIQEVTHLVLDDAGQISVDEHIKEIDNAHDEAVKYFTLLIEDGSSPEQQEIVDRIIIVGEQFLEYKDQVTEAVRSGNRSKAMEIHEDRGTAYQETLNRQLDELSQYYESRMEELSLRSEEIYEKTINFLIAFTAVGLFFAIVIVSLLIFRITSGLDKVVHVISGYNDGYQTTANKRIEVTSDDEIGQVAKAFNQLAADLEERIAWEKDYNKHKEEQIWLNTNIAQMTSAMQGVNDLEKVSDIFISGVAPMVGASYGAIYLSRYQDDKDILQLYAGYAMTEMVDMEKTIQYGEGLVGQSAKTGNKIWMKDIPDQYVKVKSGLGEAKPLQLLIYPIFFEKELVGVVELASLAEMTPLHQDLLQNLTESIGIVVQNIRGRMRVEGLLQESQTLTEELQTQSEELLSQQEELTKSNDKMEKQTGALKRSEELLQKHQSELEQRNKELTKKTKQLEEQNYETERKSKQIEKSKIALEQQALQLIHMTRYKSEFLANMSHELRTPLNSLLILSEMLEENKQGNLSEKQVEYARAIHGSGEDLLKLIDEILDLSKVEAGKMDMNPEDFELNELKEELERSFAPLAEKKYLKFSMESDTVIPLKIYTDRQRLQQILRNLVSNAIKFTQQGEVGLKIEKMDEENIAFRVTDSGIGISDDKQDLIFEAFQQGDGTTSRKFGGTGLGLSISQRLARLLGGVISVESTEGEGSTFTLILPMYYQQLKPADDLDEFDYSDLQQNQMVSDQKEPIEREEAVEKPETLTLDDRNTIEPDNRTILIIEDDQRFAELLQDMARTRGYKTLVASQGDEGLSLAQHMKPDAVILDIQLPVLDGWTILQHLKHDLATRHIPVHVITVVDQEKEGLEMGAIAYLKKPSRREDLEETFAKIESYLDRSLKKLLLVQSDEYDQERLIQQLGNKGVVICTVSSKPEAVQYLQKQHFDCMIIDLNLGANSGIELLELTRKELGLMELPIIIYTERKLDEKDEMKIRKYAETIVIKNSESTERLIDETELFLHHIEKQISAEKTVSLEDRKLSLEDKKVLIVDDDARNVFAISSMLENEGMKVSYAENGKEAVRMLDESFGFDLILMDIMMPEMDGYETMQEIRNMKLYQNIPIIAVTAKAMKNDRDKCIEAGASDYIAKPVDMDQMISLIRVWLY